MVRIISIFVVTLSLIGFVQAQSDMGVGDVPALISDTVRSARTNQLAAERILFAADQAIDAGAVIVSSVKNDRLVHTELKRLASGVPGARAIIVIGGNGQLLHDSYKYPVAPLDLSDRTYFKEALTGSELVVGKQVVGRTSGASFVPLVKRLGSPDVRCGGIALCARRPAERVRRLLVARPAAGRNNGHDVSTGNAGEPEPDQCCGQRR